MNVYDFDGTIYNGDSTAHFIKYCALKYPKTLIYLPVTVWAFFLYILGVYSKTRFKEKMYGFLKYVPENAVDEFWKQNKKNIKSWYYDQQQNDDIVISASPEFLIQPICSMIGIKTAMASVVDVHTGKYTGKNCHDIEKVDRLYKWDRNAKVNKFYSDSYADTPLAEIAEEAYMVRGDKLYKWNEYEMSGAEKFRKMFLSREFLMFVIVGVINTLCNMVLSLLYRMFIPDTTYAFIAGYITSNILSYLMNSGVTFKERLSIIKYIKFFISYLPNFIIQTGIVYLFECFVHGPDIIAYALAAVIGVPVTFVFMKIFAFRKKK